MRRFVLTIIVAMFSLGVGAKTKITSVAFEKEDGIGKLTVNLHEPLAKTPELSIKGKVVQVVVPNSFVWPSIKKNVSVDKKFDTKILAYQYTKDTVRVRAVMPYDMKEFSSKVGIVEKEKAIELFFPVVRTIAKKENPPPQVQEKGSEAYDETYLEELLNDKEIAKMEEESTPSEESGEEEAERVSDAVAMTMSAQNKGVDWSLMMYVAKFVGFLIFVLMLFFGVVRLLKKGIFNKGKLGFLNSTKVIEVLSKTYIAPKKSILTVKAYDQILLIGIDEKGMHFLTEVKNKAGLLKEGERQLVGDNFDTNIDDADMMKKEFRLKEIIDRPAKEEKKKLGDFLKGSGEKVKFSDQIKDRVKDLKSLQ